MNNLHIASLVFVSILGLILYPAIKQFIILLIKKYIKNNENNIYLILNALLQHTGCEEVFIQKCNRDVCTIVYNISKSTDKWIKRIDKEHIATTINTIIGHPRAKLSIVTSDDSTVNYCTKILKSTNNKQMHIISLSDKSALVLVYKSTITRTDEYMLYLKYICKKLKKTMHV